MSDSLAASMPKDERSGETKLGRVGRYVLRSELASGGMATVYLAHLEGPHGFEKVVAVKRIHPHLTSDRRFVSMFLDEARVAALIHHPNVCAVTDFGEFDGAPYLAMEYLSGESFSAVIKRARHEEGPNPFWLFARIIHDAARGLHTAHTLKGPDGDPLGVVHRDVSPQNIFVLYDGVTKVVDFGVARARGRMSTTQTNEVKGKLPFMSPEQFENQAVDARTDLWALGVVLWEATVGRRLFRGQNDGATIALVLNKPIPKPSDFVPDYPAKLENIIMKCLERDLSQRYQTADALADDLEEFLYAFGKPAGASQVKKWMETHFAEQIVYRESLLRGEPVKKPQVSADTETSTLSSVRSRPEPIILDDQALATVAASPQRLRVANDAEAASAGGGRKWASLVFGALIVAAVATMITVVVLDGARTPEPTVTVAPLPPLPPIDPATVTPEGPTADMIFGEPEPAREIPANERRPTTDTPARTTTEPERAVARPEAVPAPTPAPRAEPQERAAAGEPGFLNLISIPAADVRVDGRALGETPLLGVSLPAGSHRVELRDPEGRTRTLTVQIESGATTRKRVEF